MGLTQGTGRSLLRGMRGGEGDGRCLFVLANGGSHLGQGCGTLLYVGISPTGKKGFAELSSAAETQTLSVFKSRLSHVGR